MQLKKRPKRQKLSKKDSIPLQNIGHFDDAPDPMAPMVTCSEEDIRIRAKNVTLVPIEHIQLNPHNRNKHPKEQIDRLIGIIRHQGFRNPVVISNRSGHLIAGEGRYLAAKELGMYAIPVIRQDFESEEQEIAYGISDNAIASWAQLDLEGINLDVPNLGPDFNIDMLGIKGFEIDVADRGGPPSRVSQADILNNFLNSDMRFLQLIYPIDKFDQIVRRLDALCVEKNVDNYSSLIEQLIGADASPA